MGVISTKLQEFQMTESKGTTTQAGKKDEKSKYKAKVTKKPVVMKRFDQACMKKPLPPRAQTPLVKVKKERKPQRLGLYHRLNEKLNQDVQDELDKSEDSSSSSTSSDDLDSQ
ncbi:uncharacterized protein LOC114639625 [Grammomys surdaster]|uniref:uncharacterized protein LOC114639625 n=1 Tax=Grammomys surdaster TaxID=491861 RepID=UPI00109FFB3A|nr:uncharacterized protein LOC114639625 [Grammomys surdaster]